MSGAFPISNANFSTMGIRSIQNTIISKSLSGKKLSRQIDNQRFGFTAKIIIGKRSDIYGELMAFIVKQRASKENFTITPPEVKSTRGSEDQVVSVNGSHTAGDTTIAMDGFGADSAGRLKSGDFIKFAVVSKDADELGKNLQLVGNIAAVTGLDFRITAEQIQRSLSAGIASAEIFRERGVREMLGFTSGVAVTVEETKKD